MIDVNKIINFLKTKVTDVNQFTKDLQQNAEHFQDYGESKEDFFNDFKRTIVKNITLEKYTLQTSVDGLVYYLVLFVVNDGICITPIRHMKEGYGKRPGKKEYDTIHNSSGHNYKKSYLDRYCVNPDKCLSLIEDYKKRMIKKGYNVK